LLHDHTSEAIEREVSMLPHANVTTVPFHLADDQERREVSAAHPPCFRQEVHNLPAEAASRSVANGEGRAPARVVPTAEVRPRQMVRVEGQVRTLQVRPWADVPTLECGLVDDTGGVRVVFLGRRSIPGIDIGTRMRVEGRVGESRGRLAVLNPDYELMG
jgi:hypothetical protein